MFGRLLNWLVRKLGLKPLVGFSLLFLAVGSAVYAFADGLRQVSFGLLFPLFTLPLAGSWLLAKTRVRGWAAALLLTISAPIFTVLRVGALTGPLFALGRVLLDTLWQVVTLAPGEAPDFTNLSLAYAEVYSGVSALILSLADWVQSLRDGLPLVNEAAIALLWGLVIWLLSSWAGWWLRRRAQPLLALLPIGVLVAAVQAYTWGQTLILGPMLFVALLLFAYVNYDGSERAWISAKMDYPEDLPKEFAISSLVVVFGIVVVALILPSISFRGIVDFVSSFTEPQIEQAEPLIESLGLEQSVLPSGDIGSALRGGLPRLHLVGSGPELSEQIVMTVKISGGAPESAENALSLPLYWRSLTYNEYFGFGWRSSDIVIRTYPAGEQVILTSSPYHQVIQQDFRIAQGETRFLYAAGEILTADAGFRIAYRPTSRYTEIFDAHGDFFGASIDQSAFRVQSLIPMVSEERLRQASDTYPGWVSEYYLSLPDTIPNRVFRLAEELTAADETAYDRVRTLESYLRGFTYSLEVDLPPASSDLVDYFLFDLQKGYCDYYASAMVVMARSLGIPARLAVGYGRGAYDSINNRYIVSEAEAHSWVEVYFPEIGWVPFEPTASLPAITRFESQAEIPLADARRNPLDSLLPWREKLGLEWDWSLTLAVAIGGVVLLLVGSFAFDHIRLQRLLPHAVAAHLYQRLYRHGRGLGVPTRTESTPLEFSAHLEDRLSELSTSALLGKPLEEAVSQVREFTRVYVLMLYSPLTLDMEDRRTILSLWRSLRRRLWLARLPQLLPFLRGKRP